MATRNDPLDGVLVPIAETLNGEAFTTSLSSTSTFARNTSSPRPGLAVAQQDGSRLVPRIHGRQEWDCRVRVVNEGSPGRERAVELAFRPDDVHTGWADEDYAGWSPPNWLVNWNAPYWSDSSAITGYAACADRRTGRVVVVSSGGGSHYATPHAGLAWVAATTTPNTGVSGAMVQLPSGRLVYMRAGTSGVMSYSDDGGANWTRGGNRVVPSGVTGSPERADAAYLSGCIMWVIRPTSTSTDLIQLASSTDGASFELVETAATITTNTNWASPSVVAAGDRILVAYRRNADSYPTVRVCASAYQPISTGTEVVIDSVACTEVALCVEDDGIVWAFVRPSVNPDRVNLFVSYDYGASWTELDHGAFDWGGGANDYLQDLRPVCAAGRVCLLHQWVASTGNEDGSLGAMWLGGWSNVVSRSTSTARVYDGLVQRFGYGYDNIGTGTNASNVWLPLELPHDGIGYTHAATGGTVQLESPGHMSVVTSSASDYWTQTTHATMAGVVFAQVDVVSGGSVSSDDVALRVRFANGTSDRDITLRFSASTNQIRIVDNNNSSATLATYSLSISTASYTSYLVAYSVLGWEIWYQDPGALTWTEIWSGSSTNDSTTPAAQGLVGFGHVSSGTAESDWRIVAWKEAMRTQSDATDLAGFPGRPIGSQPTSIPAIGGFTDSTESLAMLSAVDGPGVLGEEWVIAADSDYAFEAMLAGVSPSPDVGWRSSGTSAINLTWDLGEDVWLGPLAVVCLNHNLLSFGLELREDAAGSWTSQGTATPTTTMTLSTLSYTRSGKSVRASGSTNTAIRYVRRNELAGGVFYDPGTGTAHRIASNTAGWWSANTEAQPEITLEDATGLGASGTCTIQGPSHILFAAPATLRARYIRLTIGSGLNLPTGETYRIGTLLICRVVPFGREAAWGGGVSVEGNVAVRRSRYGTSRARQQGPPAKRWRLSWADNMDHLIVRGGADVDYRGYSGAGGAIVPIEDTAMSLQGVYEETKAGEVPIVGVSKMPTTGTATTLSDPSTWCYGRMLSPVVMTIPTGRMGEDEVVRLDPIEIDPIV